MPFTAIRWHFEVRTDDPQLQALLHPLLEPVEAETSSGNSCYGFERHGGTTSLRLDGRLLGESNDLPSIVRLLLWSINREAVTASDDVVVLHAAVASLHGHAVVLPALAGSGKSTLVTELVRSGCSYLTDEAAAIDLDEPVVLAYHRPISLKPGSWPLFPELTDPIPDGVSPLQPKLIDARAIRSDALGGPAYPAAVVFPRYGGDQAARLEPLSAPEGLVALIEHSFNIQRLGQPGLDALAAMARRVPMYRLEFQDLRLAAQRVMEVLEVEARVS